MLRRVHTLMVLSWLAIPGFAVSGLAVSGWAGSAWGQDTPPAPSAVGVIDAISYSPIPAGAGFATQANDSTALTNDALQRVNDALGRKGYRVDNQSNLVLQVETQLVRGVKQDTPVGELTANNNEAVVQGKLYSSTQNSLLNPQRPISSGSGAYRINLSVYDKTNGLYVWRGSINRSDPTVDIEKASDEMVPALLEYLGKTEKPAVAP
jgi:hypothetical protein